MGDVRVNGDGTIDFAYGGEDLSYSYNGYNFMWQLVKGDFTLRAVIQSIPANNRAAGPKAGLMVRNSLDATSKMSAYGVKRLYEYLVLVGRQRTAAAERYYSSFQTPQSARNSARLVWAALLQGEKRIE